MIKLSTRKKGVKTDFSSDVKCGLSAKVFIWKAGAICVLLAGLNSCFAVLKNFNAKRKKLSEEWSVLVWTQRVDLIELKKTKTPVHLFSTPADGALPQVGRNSIRDQL